jgi:hypothetical protein
LAFTNLYHAAGEAGRLLTYLNPRDAELSLDVDGLLAVLDTISGARGASRINAVKFLAAQRWTAAQPDDGLLIAGTVTQIQPAGRLFEIALDAGSRTKLVVPVLTTANPDDLCAVGDVLVIAGRLLDDPQRQLPGYAGQQARVLLLGQAVRAPKTE